MRKIALIVSALVLALVALGSPMVTHAAGADCWADSYKLAQGESTVVYCSGFSPLTIINVYYAEPDGTAVAYGDTKSDAGGNIAFGWGNGVKKEYSYSLGTYTVVAQQLGPAKTVLAYGKVEIENVGDGDHVSGAYLSADKTTIDRSSEGVTISGWGFAPYEIVTVWLQNPPVCSSFTYHYVDGKNGGTFENWPTYADISTSGLGDIKASSSGAFSFPFRFFSAACEGTYRFAARGNTSGWGAYVDVVVTGPSVSTNAWLVPSRSTVGAFNDTIQFHASGFGANEILNCWTTSPEGRAVPYGVPGSFDQIKVGADGSGVISLTTGSYVVSRDDPYYSGFTTFPLMSEGSLGVWKMTCRGIASNTTAIAEYTVYGYETAP